MSVFPGVVCGETPGVPCLNGLHLLVLSREKGNVIPV